MKYEYKFYDHIFGKNYCGFGSPFNQYHIFLYSWDGNLLKVKCDEFYPMDYEMMEVEND